MKKLAITMILGTMLAGAAGAQNAPLTGPVPGSPPTGPVPTTPAPDPAPDPGPGPDPTIASPPHAA